MIHLNFFFICNIVSLLLNNDVAFVVTRILLCCKNLLERNIKINNSYTLIPLYTLFHSENILSRILFNDKSNQINIFTCSVNLDS